MTTETAKPTTPASAAEKPAQKTPEKRPREEDEKTAASTPSEKTNNKESNAQAKRRKLGLNLESTTEFNQNSGLLLTCQSKFVQRKAQVDALKMLQRAVDEAKEKENTTDKKEEGTKDSVAAALEAEKKELEVQAHKFEVIQDAKVPDAVVFIKFNKNDEFKMSPTELADLMCQRVLDKKDSSKNVMKLSPLDFLCKPHLDQFKQLAEKHIKPIFATKEGENKPVWALQFKSRNMKTFDKTKVLEVIDQYSGGAKVSLDNPDICITVELNPLFCGVGLLKNWQKFDKYNLNALINPEQSKKEREAMKVRQQKVEAEKKAAEEKKAEKKKEEKKE